MLGLSGWIPWTRKRGVEALWALVAVLLCCHQSCASSSNDVDMPVFLEEPMSVVQKLGATVTLRCSALPSHANVTWRLNGRELVAGDDAELGVVTQPGSLLILSLSNRTLGRYQCVATTAIGAAASVPANVTAAKLRDFEPDDQQEIEVDEGNTAVIECHLPESQPKAQVRYSVRQEWLEASKGNYLIMPSGNLQIANATQQDEGAYTCAAYNPITMETKTSTSADRLRIRRSTSEAARIIYPPDSRAIMVTKGQRLVLECVASGMPTPQVTWAKDGQPLPLRQHNHTRLLLSNLLIDAAAESDSGTYTCHASNGLGPASNRLSTAATVQYDVQVFEPPQVRVDLQTGGGGGGGEVLWGSSVRLVCQVRAGKPPPSVMWLHNAVPLPPSSPRHRLSQRSLRLLAVGPQDDGVYQCLAENQVGSSQAAARLLTLPTGSSSRGSRLPQLPRLSPDKVLREQPPPRTPAAAPPLVDCSELRGQVTPADGPIILSQPRTVRADFYELTWKPRQDGGSPVLEYIVKYRKAGDPPGEWVVSSVSGVTLKMTLTKLQPSSLYEVEMIAHNCAGLGQPAMMTFRTGKGRKGERPDNQKPHVSMLPSLSPPEAPDRPTVSMATETSAYVTWIPRGNRGFPIQSFRVEYRRLKKENEWAVAVENIPPSRLSVEVTNLEKGTSYKFRVIAVNYLGASPPSAPSKPYAVVGGGKTSNPRPVDGPYITYNEAINETTIILKWTYTPANNTSIYGFYIYYRPTDSDNDNDYKRDVVEGDRYWHSITDLQPETAYDIKMQCYNEGGESEFGNVVILETKARSGPRAPTPETVSPGPGPDGSVTRAADYPYLIMGLVLVALVAITVFFVIPYCLCTALLKQKQAGDLCFPVVAPPVATSCQYTMVPLQGGAVVTRCPLDPRLHPPTHPHPHPNGDYLANGKIPTHTLPGMHQEEADCEMECDTLLPQAAVPNGHPPPYYGNGCPMSPDLDVSCCLPDDSTLELLRTPGDHGTLELMRTPAADLSSHDSLLLRPPASLSSQNSLLLRPPSGLSSRDSLELQRNPSQATTLEDEILADLQCYPLSTPEEGDNATMPFEDDTPLDTHTTTHASHTQPDTHSTHSEPKTNSSKHSSLTPLDTLSSHILHTLSDEKGTWDG
ncbi:brother of CDO [Engraulis encrasicolus]|uniref:brother of CDO n=1 Tax=Engraulis encrasicolus TaxID=184585 RepID=UPI002FD21CCB